ncbi:cytochrome P450 2F3 [Caerostris extrusa]|uniref:Cytochrome P450 2F3 n=1 Tax=Caerostris extrusa TaxID=172846 RepID=A0AAV4Y843_CAEEX|nr:cytochrome P450 2F3 [Caerostris extrusa]
MFSNYHSYFLDNTSPALRMLLVFVVVLCFVRSWMRRSHGKTPPGPLCLPILGYLLQIRNNYHVKLTQLHKQFGSVYQIYLGTKRVVVINDPQLIRDAFRQKVFSGRPDTGLTKLLQGLGVINSVGELWHEQRAFLHTFLRNFGAKNMGPNKTTLERNMQEQVSELLTSLSETNGSPINIRPKFATAVSNVIDLY